MGQNWKKISSETFLDTKTNLYWMLTDYYEQTHKYAEELQNNYIRLPTKEEFKEAEANGIREIFDMNHKYYWSSSDYPDRPNTIYVFSGYYGSLVCDSRNGNNCVIWIYNRDNHQCSHDYKQYIGFTEQYEYCTKCNEKK